MTSDAGPEDVRGILDGIDHITALTVEQGEDGLVSARIKTDLGNVYGLSRSIFTAFAAKGAALLEMSVKKAGLEDIFLELAEGDEQPPVPDREYPESEVADR